jgi:epsilon-lactone hydrolase
MNIAKSPAPPQSISVQAQTFLVNAASAPSPPSYPAVDDKVAWRSWVAECNRMTAGLFGSANPPGVVVEPLTVGSIRTYVATPLDAPPDRAYLDIHGGLFVLFGGETCRAMGAATAKCVGVRTYAVDYRMPPDHPYPHALDDCMVVYKMLLERYGADKLVVGGGSAGANLAAALMLRARDAGLPLPAGLVLLTPEADLTESGDSFQTNRDLDVVLKVGAAAPNALYADGHDLKHPYLSPLFGDFTGGFPRTFLQAGTRDLFLSNAVRLHRVMRDADVDAQLHVFEAMPHGGFGGAPEDADLAAELRRFVDSCWG